MDFQKILSSRVTTLVLVALVAVFGIHVGIGAGAARVVATPGPAMAASDRFEIRVRGVQTHGAMPWNGVDPIVTAAQIIMGLQTIASRQVDVTKAPSIISVGRIDGRSGRCVLAQKILGMLVDVGVALPEKDAGHEQPATVLNSVMEVTRAGGGIGIATIIERV